jgi:hypothetical protein
LVVSLLQLSIDFPVHCICSGGICCSCVARTAKILSLSSNGSLDLSGPGIDVKLKERKKERAYSCC